MLQDELDELQAKFDKLSTEHQALKASRAQASPEPTKKVPVQRQLRYEGKDGHLYSIRNNRSVIINGKKHTAARAIANAHVMEKLIERRWNGLQIIEE